MEKTGLTPADNTYDAIVLGAGGAGLMCAGVAGQRGRRILVVDHADEPGKKILISGGGRCNFTNIQTPPERFLSTNPHFAKSALSRYRPRDFIELVDRHAIAWHEKTLGQLFCDGSARQIVAMLLKECAVGDVKIALGNTIRDIVHADGVYRVSTDAVTANAPALVIATGGPSIPKMGATGFAYEVASRFGLGLITPRPALVPLTLDPNSNFFEALTGLATEVVARCGKASFREASLFTHKGLSGPAILQISSYWHPGDLVEIDFIPEYGREWLFEAKRTAKGVHMRKILAGAMPDRLAARLSEQLDLPGELGNISDEALLAANQRLKAWQFQPVGTEGYAKAEVTAGGIDTGGLSSKTMEANDVPGLFAIGEAVDVTGWLGGYNFQWAWASGHAAGLALAAR